MRVALVGDWLGPDGMGSGGVARVVRALAKGYESLGVEVVVFYPRRRGLSAVRTGALVPFGCSLGPQTLLYWSINAWDLRRQLRRVRPDAIHLHGAAAWGIYLPRELVFTAHGNLGNAVSARCAFGRLLGKGIGMLERRVASGFRVVTAQSEQAGRIFFGSGAQVVSNPIYEGFYKTLRSVVEASAPIRAVVVGRISPEKGTIDAIRWFKENAPSDWNMVIVGQKNETPYYAQCSAMAARSRAKVEFTHPASQEDVVTAMLKADILLLPSHEENSPLVVAEALAVGLPVIANDVGAVRAMLSGVAGCMLLDRFDDLRVEDVVSLVAFDRGKVDAREVRRMVAEKYNARRVARRFLDLLSLSLEQS